MSNINTLISATIYPQNRHTDQVVKKYYKVVPPKKVTKKPRFIRPKTELA